jgi:hypothetical protein
MLQCFKKHFESSVSSSIVYASCVWLHPDHHPRASPPPQRLQLAQVTRQAALAQRRLHAFVQSFRAQDHYAPMSTPTVHALGMCARVWVRGESQGRAPDVVSFSFVFPPNQKHFNHECAHGLVPCSEKNAATLRLTLCVSPYHWLSDSDPESLCTVHRLMRSATAEAVVLTRQPSVDRLLSEVNDNYHYAMRSACMLYRQLGMAPVIVSSCVVS